MTVVYIVLVLVLVGISAAIGFHEKPDDTEKKEDEYQQWLVDRGVSKVAKRERKLK